VEVDGEDRSKRGKRGGRKRLLNLPDGTRTLLPASASAPEGATETLVPLQEMYSPPPDMDTLRQRVLDQLHSGNFAL
jgi:nicotinate phosphoribosyltransferase